MMRRILAAVSCLVLIIAIDLLAGRGEAGLEEDKTEVVAELEASNSATSLEALSKQTWTKPLMQEIFASVAYLLPRSIDRERFASEAERPGILSQLDTFAAAASRIESHGNDRGSSVSFLGNSLSQDIEQVRMRYEAGLHEEARYFLVGSVQNCFACHSRRPSNRNFERFSELTEVMNAATLSEAERAVLFVVTRRFEEAMDSWEKLLRDMSFDAYAIEEEGVLSDYLAIAIRGLAAHERARTTLEAFSKRSDVSPQLAGVISAWVDALRVLEQQPQKGAPLEFARGLVERATSQSEWLGDRRGLVYDLAASAVLNQLSDIPRSEAAALRGEELAETYYLLGLIESRSLTTFWIDEGPNLLEAAVRVAPDSAIADRAFALLEQNMILDYGGASNEDLPIDVWTRLNALRAIVGSSNEGGSVN